MTNIYFLLEKKNLWHKFSFIKNKTLKFKTIKSYLTNI